MSTLQLPLGLQSLAQNQKILLVLSSCITIRYGVILSRGFLAFFIELYDCYYSTTQITHVSKHFWHQLQNPIFTFYLTRIRPIFCQGMAFNLKEPPELQAL